MKPDEVVGWVRVEFPTSDKEINFNDVSVKYDKLLPKIQALIAEGEKATKKCKHAPEMEGEISEDGFKRGDIRCGKCGNILEKVQPVALDREKVSQFISNSWAIERGRNSAIASGKRMVLAEVLEELESGRFDLAPSKPGEGKV